MYVILNEVKDLIGKYGEKVKKSRLFLALRSFDSALLRSGCQGAVMFEDYRIVGSVSATETMIGAS